MRSQSLKLSSNIGDGGKPIFNPDTYEYESFEDMMNYALDFIEKCYPNGECDIIKAPERNSYFIEIGDKKYRISKTQLKIFSFLCKYRGETIKETDIICFGLSNREELKDILKIDNLICEWNGNIAPELRINNMWGSGYYVGIPKKSTIKTVGNIRFEKSGNKIQIYKGDKLQSSIQFTPSELDIFIQLITKGFIKKPRDPKKVNIYGVHIANIRKKLKQQPKICIKVIKGEGHKLVINSPDTTVEQTKVGTEEALK